MFSQACGGELCCSSKVSFNWCGSVTGLVWPATRLSSSQVLILSEVSSGLGSCQVIVPQEKLASGDERSDLWKRLTAAHPNYGGYQRKTEREIPVVVLDPVG